MGILAVGASLIISGVSAAIVAVAAAVVTISKAVYATIALIGALAVKAMAAVVTGIAGNMPTILAAVKWTASKTYTFVLSHLTKYFHNVATLAKLVAAGMKTFLEAIHFNTILKLHNISMIFSKDYRMMMRKVYNEISKVSESLGLSPHFIGLALRDARNIVLDVSSLMGRSYDLAEVEWMTTMNDYLKEFETKVKFYETDPAQVLNDIAYWVEKPLIDARAGFQRSFLQLVDGVITVADNTAGKVVKLREDLETAILHLPTQIGSTMYEYMKPKFAKVDKFIEEEYYPTSSKLQQTMDIINDTNRKNTDKLHDIAQQILNPGDMMSNVDSLPDFERIRQERIIAEVANREGSRQIESTNQMIDDASPEIHKIFEAAKEVRPKPEYHVPEQQGPISPAGVSPLPRLTWFVGDY